MICNGVPGRAGSSVSGMLAECENQALRVRIMLQIYIIPMFFTVEDCCIQYNPMWFLRYYQILC